ncbi:hypothetical protein [Halovivax gelatinilyticus]|uniref:hypothetical protein n=1 Tax=Halovivax gelatinilyticus TaxID=2961597 RepID=UPI0020CA5509|nr:hypothetical protein [Halovivax gelatinilyticus]
MSENDGQIGRRKVLKLLPVSALPASGLLVGTSMATDRTESVNTDFDPTNEREVAEFFVSASERSESIQNKLGSSTKQNGVQDRTDVLLEWAKEIVDNLSSEQIQSVLELIDTSEMIFDSHATINKSKEENETNGWAFASYVDTTTASIRVPILGYRVIDVLDFTHEIEWEYKPLEGVRNVSARAQGEGSFHPPVHTTYQGDDGEDIQIRADGNYFVSDMEGSFRRCAIFPSGTTCPFTDRMYTRLAGNWNGSGTRTRREFYRGGTFTEVTVPHRR